MPKMIEVQFKRIHKFAKRPTKANDLDLGYDFYVVADDDFAVLTKDMAPAFVATPDYCRASLVIPPGETHMFHLGIKVAIQEGYGCLLWDRSGMGGKRLLHRFAGVIDGTYRGEWMCRLFNHSNEAQVIHEHDRIVQGVLTEVINGTWDEVDELPASVRGEGGFGSSGR